MTGRLPGPERLLRTYFLAKDSNRPHLLGQVFAQDAELEMVVQSEAISFPPRSTGLAAIAEVLARRFGQVYENVYSFYLAPPPAADVDEFSCDWMVGMSEKTSGAVRVGCGEYRWRFRTDPPRLAERLVITIRAMQVLKPDALGPVMQWLTGLPYPWCPVATAVETAPDIVDLKPVIALIRR